MRGARAILAFALLAAGCGSEDSETGTPGGARAERDRHDWNVLLITMDTTRADALGAYGRMGDVTPNLDRLAAEGTLFHNCTTSAPSTLPSHASILTGKHPYAHGARANAGYVLPEGNVTLAEVLRDAGWRTAAEIAAPVIDGRTQLDQGFESYRDLKAFDVTLKHVGRITGGGPERLELSERTATDISRFGLEFMRSHKAERFFLWLHYFDPHAMYAPPANFASRYPKSPYHAEVAFADDQIGRILDELDSSQLAERTLVVFTADHGEGLGEHGEQTHSYFVYDTTTRVPLILRGPGVPAGHRIQSLVRTIDIAPTLLDLLGLPPLADVQGTSLRPLLAGNANDLHLLGYGESIEALTTFDADILRFVRDGRWKYIHKINPELYDVVADPQEEHNVAADHPEVVERLRERLSELVAGATPAPTGAEVEIDSETRDQLDALGYVGGSEAPEIRDELAALELSGPDPATLAQDVARLSHGWGFVKGERPEEGAEVFRDLVARYPESLPMLRGLMAAVRQLEREDELISLLERAVAMAPDDAELHRQLADLSEKQGRVEDAEADLRAALKVDPCATLPRSQLARLLSRGGRYEARIQVLREGMERCGEQPSLLNDYAYALATCPDARYRDGADALRMAQQVVDGIGKANPAFLDTLAAAYAETGEFVKAVVTARRALELLSSRQAPEEVVQIFEDHLAAFEQGRPLREP